VTHKSEVVEVPKGEIHRRLHRAFLRYHDQANWPMLRTALIEMGKGHLIGNSPQCLVPAESRNELRGKEQKAYARRSVNKAHAKGKNNKGAKEKAQRGLTRFSDDQPHNDAARANKPKNKTRKRR
jgi:hypothetical protein